MNVSMRPLQAHLVRIALLVGIIAVLYGRVTTAYFCGYDDFYEVQRAEFIDRIEPLKILTTSHYDSFKYRPLNRWANLETYLIRPQDALSFRVRNLIFHGIAVIGIYFLGCLLFESSAVGLLGALFFSIHPLANQPVLAAVFGNSVANALFIFTLVLFLQSLKRDSLPWFIASLICGTAAVYELRILHRSAGNHGRMVVLCHYIFTRESCLPPGSCSCLCWWAALFLDRSSWFAIISIRKARPPIIYGPAVAIKAMVEYAAIRN